MEKIWDAAVVGGGIAGYTAALTLKNLGVEALWLGEPFAGKLRLAETVKNFPSFSGSGEEFYAALSRQKEDMGLKNEPLRVNGIYAQGDMFSLAAGEKLFLARAVVLATGVEEGSTLKGEKEFLGRGVSYCAVCDGALYRGKKIAAVLSSLRYAEEAEYLARFASEVLVFCGEKGSFRAENISVHTEKPLAIRGEKRVEALVTERGELPVSGVFLLKDALPPEALCGGLGTEGAHVVTRRDGSTNLRGLFAAGDIAGRPYQFAKAAGEGLVAAYAVRDYLRTLSK